MSFSDVQCGLQSDCARRVSAAVCSLSFGFCAEFGPRCDVAARSPAPRAAVVARIEPAEVPRKLVSIWPNSRPSPEDLATLKIPNSIPGKPRNSLKSRSWRGKFHEASRKGRKATKKFHAPAASPKIPNSLAPQPKNS